MTKLRIIIQSLTICLLLAAASSFAQAQTRTWVSGTGSDANPCSRTAPCQTFSGAIAKTSAGGEISVLDPHGYGAVTITKSITINGEGTLTSILVGLNGAGVTVNAGASDTVYLKNLDINGANNGLNGINWIGGNALVVEKTRIYNFTGTGINVNKVAGGFLSVSNVTTSNCVAGGIVSTTSSGTVRAEIYETKVFGSTNGFKAGANSQFAIKSSAASGCGTAGFIASGSTAVMSMDSCVASNNGDGVKVESSGTVRMGASTVSNNILKGLNNAGGTIESFQDNYISGNPASSAPSTINPS